MSTLNCFELQKSLATINAQRAEIARELELLKNPDATLDLDGARELKKAVKELDALVERIYLLMRDVGLPPKELHNILNEFVELEQSVLRFDSLNDRFVLSNADLLERNDLALHVDAQRNRLGVLVGKLEKIFIPGRVFTFGSRKIAVDRASRYLTPSSSCPNLELLVCSGVGGRMADSYGIPMRDWYLFVAPERKLVRHKQVK